MTIDDEIQKIKNELYDKDTDTLRFDPKAQLLNTKYFTKFVKLVARLLPILKTIDDWKQAAKVKVQDFESRITYLETVVVNLEERVTALENPP